MISVEGHKPLRQPDIRPHLVLRIKTGWHYDAERRRFVSSKGDQVIPKRDLPKWTRIVPMIPDLAGKSAARLSPEDRNLARYFHILLPRGSKPRTYLNRVKGWVCAEEVTLPAEIGLP
jgi:hypothetical protein